MPKKKKNVKNCKNCMFFFFPNAKSGKAISFENMLLYQVERCHEARKDLQKFKIEVDILERLLIPFDC